MSVHRSRPEMSFVRVGAFFRSYRLLIGWIVSVVIITCIAWIGGVALFSVKTIEIVSNHPGVVIDPSLSETNMFALDEGDMARQIAASYPSIESVSVEKRWPDSLRIVLDFPDPVAVLMGSSQKLLVSGKGMIIAAVGEDAGLPVIEMREGELFGVGTLVQTRWALDALAFLQNYPYRHDIQTIAYTDENTVAVRFGTTSVLLRSDGMTSEAAATLQTLVDSFRIRGSMPIRVDLRFEKPVVVF